MGTILFLLAFGLLIGGIASTAAKSFAAEKFAGLGLGLALVIPAFLIFLFAVGFSPVDAGSVGVVTRMGAVSGTLPPGPHFVYPFIARVNPVSVKTLVVKPSEDAASHDLQMVHVEVTLAYHFDQTHITEIFTNLIDGGDNAVENKVINPAILESIKASTSQFDAQELVSNRAAVRDKIEAMVKERLAPYHIVAETTSITDFRFSKEYEDSIEQKVVAQQNAEKATNDLTRIKIEADQKVAAAQGEAQALKAQKEQITPELLQLRMIEMLQSKWDGRLPENYYGGSSPLPIVEALKGAKK